MVKLNQEEKEFIINNLPNGIGLVKAEHVNEILDPLDDFIIEKGFDDNYDLNDIGRIAQNMYDDIYWRNE